MLTQMSFENPPNESVRKANIVKILCYVQLVKICMVVYVRVDSMINIYQEFSIISLNTTKHAFIYQLQFNNIFTFRIKL